MPSDALLRPVWAWLRCGRCVGHRSRSSLQLVFSEGPVARVGRSTRDGGCWSDQGSLASVIDGVGDGRAHLQQWKRAVDHRVGARKSVLAVLRPDHQHPWNRLRLGADVSSGGRLVAARADRMNRGNHRGSLIPVFLKLNVLSPVATSLTRLSVPSKERPRQREVLALAAVPEGSWRSPSAMHRSH